MQELLNLVYILYIVLNAVAFALMGRDKYLARQRRWRIPERWLFGIALAGGALGIWFGMKAFRHKTNHKLFVWGIPALFIVNLLMLYELMQIVFS